MGRTMLPSGELVSVTPRELLKYAGPDAIRQILHQERMHWTLKTNKDADYLDQERLFHYASEIHNDGDNLRVELRTFPDNGAYPGFAGVNVDSGVFGIPHSFDKWDGSLSNGSKEATINRVTVGATADIPEKSGFGYDEDQKEMSSSTSKRTAGIICDPYDGRVYLLSNDSSNYVNNEKRNEDTKIPARAVARICDIPTKISQLGNNMEFISDPTFQHTDNNFTHTNRFVLDNIDDRTFVYPELAKDVNGNYIENLRVGLSGNRSYAESDGSRTQNTQPNLNGDRSPDEAVSSYGANVNFSDSYHSTGYLPGVFRSLKELEKVDLVNQRQSPLKHLDSPSSRRDKNYYHYDGIWTSNWYDESRTPSYKKPSLIPTNMEQINDELEPVPYSVSSPSFDRTQLYQWRYNRLDVVYPSDDITMRILEDGLEYQVGDILKWSFGDDVFIYEVTRVGANGQIQEGHYAPDGQIFYDQDPDTHGVGLEFNNTSSIGHGAKIEIKSKPKIISMATQLKNNLYAYVDVTPTVRSDNTTQWSDTKLPDSQDGKIFVRSTAAGPAYSGINSGRGGVAPSVNTSSSTLYEHGGNATAGAHVHLFRYVINTQNPTWKVVDGVKVYTGKWVDQGPMGLERPCDIKALLFSNPDCNNFNNYYKFMLDMLIDTFQRNADSVASNNPQSLSIPKIHIDQKDPTAETRFTEKRINPETGSIEEVDITDKIIYFNAATGIMFIYNTTAKSDQEYGYGYRAPGWMAIAGATSR